MSRALAVAVEVYYTGMHAGDPFPLETSFGKKHVAAYHVYRKLQLSDVELPFEQTLHIVSKTCTLLLQYGH